jgi:hypothetical protein
MLASEKYVVESEKFLMILLFALPQVIAGPPTLRVCLGHAPTVIVT